MKIIRFSLILAMLAALLVTSAVYADSPDPFAPSAPDVINTITVSPDPSVVGGTVSFSVDYDTNISAYINAALCIYYATGDRALWETAYDSSTNTSAAGLTYAEVEDSTDCPSVGGYGDFYKLVADTTNGGFGDTIAFEVTVPAVSAGSKIVAFRLYMGSDCDDSAGDNSDAPGGANCGTSGGSKSKSFTVQSAPTTVYASDQANCGGYGSAGVSCFNALSTAITKAQSYNSTELVIVGDLTVDTGEVGTITEDLTTVRGISSGRLAMGSGCAAETQLTINKTSVTVRDLTFDGTTCSGAATGLAFGASASSGIVAQNLTVQSFSGGTGVSFIAGSAGTLKSSTISGNATGVSEATAGAVSIGTGPSDGNTLTNNTTGINSNGGATIKGNTLSGGTAGISLGAAATAIYGNRVTGASSQQIDCAGGVAGAAFNYLGGSNPNTGSDCTDVTSQLGANWVSWADAATTLNEASTTAAAAMFDLGSNAPFGVGTAEGLPNLTSNFYAVMGAGTVSIASTGNLYSMSATPGTDCLSGGSNPCWNRVGGGGTGSSTAPNHFVMGTSDPTAIQLRSLSATSARSTWLPVALLAAAVILGGGGLILARKRR